LTLVALRHTLHSFTQTTHYYDTITHTPSSKPTESEALPFTRGQHWQSTDELDEKVSYKMEKSFINT